MGRGSKKRAAQQSGAPAGALVPSLLSPRSRGGEALAQGRLVDAVACFDQALREHSGQADEAPILLSRLQAYIGLRRYASALRDAETAAALNPNDAESLWHRGVCEDALGLYRRAAESFACASAAPNSEPWRVKCEHGRLDALRHFGEQNVGSYSWGDLHRSVDSHAVAADTVPDPLPVASFCGSVEVQPVSGHGLGLVLMEDIAEGALVFACKAFALARTSELHRVTCERLRTCPKADFDRFFSLYDGSNSERSVPVALNIEGRPSDDAPGPDASAREFDEQRVERILRYCTHSWDKLNKYGASENIDVCGVWILPPFLNHSCRPNVQRTFIGDLMLCRSSRPLTAGTELLDAYVSVFQPLHIRRGRLKADFGFECRCARCSIEEALLPPGLAAPVLARLDEAVEETGQRELEESAGTFDQLSADVDQMVMDIVRAKVAEICDDVRLRESCAQLWGKCALEERGVDVLRSHLECLLRGSFLPVFKGAAFVRRQLREPARCAKAYRRCLELLEEVFPGSAYHAHWAAECATQAFNASVSADVRDPEKRVLREEMARLAQYARRWNTTCNGSELFRPSMESFGWPQELIAIAEASLDETEGRRGNDGRGGAGAGAVGDSASWMGHSVAQEDGRLLVSFQLPPGLEAADVELDVGSECVVATCNGGENITARRWLPLRVALPQTIAPASAPPAKYKRRLRMLVLELPFA